jgi:hypothetical protein
LSSCLRLPASSAAPSPQLITWESKFNRSVYACWGLFLTSPLGKTLTPRAEVIPQGWICPLGVKLSPGGEILCSPLYSSRQ